MRTHLHFSRSGIARLAAALCLIASPAVHAADPVIGSASATISGLTYTLVDLAPDDGLAPNVTFTGLHASTNAGMYAAPGGWSGNNQLGALNGLTSASTLATTYGASQAVADTQGYTATSGLLLSDVMNRFNTGTVSGQYINGLMSNASSQAVRLSTDPDLSKDFVLGAHTKLVITGMASVTGHFDQAALLSAMNAIPFNSESSISPHLMSQVEIAAWGVDGEGLADLSTADTSRFAMAPSSDSLDYADEQAFSITLNNTGDTALNGRLDLITNAAVVLNAHITVPVVYVPAGPVSGIPEPSTWALMALGLVGVALRRSQAQQGD